MFSLKSNNAGKFIKESIDRYYKRIYKLYEE